MKRSKPAKVRPLNAKKAKPEAPTGKPATQEVKVGKAKGRPMLQWVGKRPLDRVTAFPAQPVERFDSKDAPVKPAEDPYDWENWPNGYPHGGLLFHGDNQEVLAHLLANGLRRKINLIYIDPPFDSGADYVRRVTLRGTSSALLAGESYVLGEQIQYTDIWANDNYLQFMYERLLLLRELLADDGSIYMHTDSHRTHQLRCLMDEVFGSENFKNDIIWQRFNYRADGLKFGTVHDTILLYTKSNEYAFKKPYVSFKPSYIKSHFRPDPSGKLYRLDNLTAPAHGKTGKAMRFGDKEIAPSAGTMWRFAQEGLDKLWDQGLIEIPEDGYPQIKRYLEEIEGQAVHTLWTDVSSINSQSWERTDYPTQKPEVLLDRIVATSSEPGDLVLHCFVGSGTTAAVAQKLGRRWIAADINKGAIQTTSKRLQEIIYDQIGRSDLAKAIYVQPTLIGADDVPAAVAPPAQRAFYTYRVNDYDLQIQHNEAVNLACEYIGVERMSTDRYFDGKLGKRLVKIVPFNHPLSPLDLEEVKIELKARPEEDRDITIIGLGKEAACDAWLEDWNRLRRQGRVPNQIEVIELRTDPKYGKFFAHNPGKAEVKITRQKDKLVVKITDFLSPTIVERLSAQEGVLKPQITDWRSMVDTVMIDTAYNGEVFNIILADVPEKKTDLVAGEYELAAAKGTTTVAVKITDMLGEEVLVTETV
jgi:DNA modification methylase